MSATLIIAFMQFLIGQARELWVWARQNQGMDIPDWEVITNRFDAQQAKLDAAKKG